MKNFKFYIAAMVVLVLFFGVNAVRADWPVYDQPYNLPGFDDVTIVFHVPMQSDSPVYHGTGIATIQYPVESEPQRGAIGTPYREGPATFERVDVLFYVFNDLWPDDYTVFFNYAGTDFELDFSGDKSEAVRIHPDLPVKLILPGDTASAQVYGGGE